MRGELGTPGSRLSPLASSSSRAKLGGSGGSWVLYRGPRSARGCGEVVGSPVGSRREMRRPGPWWEALGPLGAGQAGAAGVVAGAGAAVRRACVPALTGLDTRLVACVAGLPTAQTAEASAQALPLAQSLVNLRKSRPPSRHLVPAFDHECIHPAGAILGAGKQLSRADHLNHL